MKKMIEGFFCKNKRGKRGLNLSKKYKRLSEKDKEDIRTMKANGKKLREIAEIYNYSISSIHRIINEK